MKITAIHTVHATNLKGKSVVVKPGETDDIQEKQAHYVVGLGSAAYADGDEATAKPKAKKPVAKKAPAKKPAAKAEEPQKEDLI